MHKFIPIIIQIIVPFRFQKPVLPWEREGSLKILFSMTEFNYDLISGESMN